MKLLMLLTIISCGVQVDRNTTRIAKSTESLEGRSEELVLLFDEFVEVFKELNMSLKDLATLSELAPDIRYLLTEMKVYLEEAKKESESRTDDEVIDPTIDEDQL